jgi:aromatic ring-opening dioxygenase LigB subunit
MPLVYACIAPHGGIIPGLEGAEACAQTTAAMDELGRRMEAARPETVVVVTPHGVRVDGALAISMSERAMGSLDEPATEERAAFSVRVDLAVDGDFSRALLGGATLASVPAVGVHYGATSGAGDCYPLDWGAVIPLHFLGARWETPPRVTIVVPSRLLPLDALVAFGQVIADATEASGRRVALVASADQAHAHAVDGPYGYDPAAAQFDDWIIEAVRANDLLCLLKVDMELVRRACPDALWQMLVLTGALERAPMTGELLSYERPTYFGMLVAAYAPAAITSRP